MSAFISTFKQESDEYLRLEIAALIMNRLSPNGWSYRVGETYFDFGQDWKWTTILCTGNKYGSYQALYPKQQEDIIMASGIDEMVSIVNGIFADKFCPDRKKN